MFLELLFLIGSAAVSVVMWLALADVTSAIWFHVESSGIEVLDVDPPVLEAFVAEAGVTI